MQTIIETRAYIASAKAEGMSDDDRTAVADRIAANPTAGVLIKGSGGCRKVRVARRGQGKSGGYRIVTDYAAPDLPAFLIAALSKRSRANSSQAEVNAMAKVTGTLVVSLGPNAAG